MFRTLIRQTTGLLIGAALIVAGSVPSYGATVNVPVTVTATVPVQIFGADNCTSWLPGGTATAPTLTCQTGGGGGPVAPSGCSATASPPGPLAVGGGTTTVSVTCSGGGAPTSYAWSAIPAVAGLQSTTSVNSQGPLNITQTTTFYVTPSNGGGGGNLASANVAVSTGGGGGGGGGGTINCATNAIGTGVSGNTQVIDFAWGSQTHPTTSGFGPNDAVVVRFTAGQVQSTSLGTITIVSGAQNPDYRAYLSDTACDFHLPPTLGYGAVAGGWTPTVWFTVGQNDGSGDPVLVPGRIYYYNIKIGPSSCGGGNCNGFIDFRTPAGG
jgi:hypothetical protein